MAFENASMCHWEKNRAWAFLNNSTSTAFQNCFFPVPCWNRDECESHYAFCLSSCVSFMATKHLFWQLNVTTKHHFPKLFDEGMTAQIRLTAGPTTASVFHRTPEIFTSSTSNSWKTHFSYFFPSLPLLRNWIFGEKENVSLISRDFAKNSKLRFLQQLTSNEITRSSRASRVNYFCTPGSTFTLHYIFFLKFMTFFLTYFNLDEP